ncbi:hypothetical protein FO519_009533 [Halicephalobus sp. NKZ332]|nr:hypothetical protein FO519_009533 [Halicephalobus sp. NKZ332]
MGDSAGSKEPTTPKPTETAAPGNEDPKSPSIDEILPFGNWINSGKNWGSSFVQSAKEKTLSTLEMVKKDLNEFSDTVTQEASAIANATTDAVKQQAQLFHQFVTTPDGEDEAPDYRTEEEKNEAAELEKKTREATTSNIPSSSSGFGFGWINNSLKSVVDTVQKFATEETTNDEHLFTEKIQLGPVRQSLLDNYELSQIQNEKKTFLTEPDNQELYKEWLNDFRIAEYNGEINTLLGNNPRLRELYAGVVPSEVDNHTFWNRYFFKVYQKEEEKKTKEQQLEINVNGAKGKKEEKRTTPEGSDGNDKDETWSMCSSTHDQLNEIPDEVSDVEPQGPMTPKANDDQPPEDWEKFDGETTKESNA